MVVSAMICDTIYHMRLYKWKDVKEAGSRNFKHFKVVHRYIRFNTIFFVGIAYHSNCLPMFFMILSFSNEELRILTQLYHPCNIVTNVLSSLLSWHNIITHNVNGGCVRMKMSMSFCTHLKMSFYREKKNNITTEPTTHIHITNLNSVLNWCF